MKATLAGEEKKPLLILPPACILKGYLPLSTCTSNKGENYGQPPWSTEHLCIHANHRVTQDNKEKQGELNKNLYEPSDAYISALFLASFHFPSELSLDESNNSNRLLHAF